MYTHHLSQDTFRARVNAAVLYPIVLCPVIWLPPTGSYFRWIDSTINRFPCQTEEKDVADTFISRWGLPSGQVSLCLFDFCPYSGAPVATRKNKSAWIIVTIPYYIFTTHTICLLGEWTLGGSEYLDGSEMSCSEDLVICSESRIRLTRMSFIDTGDNPSLSLRRILTL